MLRDEVNPNDKVIITNGLNAQPNRKVKGTNGLGAKEIHLETTTSVWKLEIAGQLTGWLAAIWNVAPCKLMLFLQHDNITTQCLKNGFEAGPELLRFCESHPRAL